MWMPIGRRRDVVAVHGGVTNFHKVTDLVEQMNLLSNGLALRSWVSPTGLHQDVGRAVFLPGGSREELFSCLFWFVEAAPPIPWTMPHPPCPSSKPAMTGPDFLTLCHSNTLSSASLFHFRESLWWHLVHPDHTKLSSQLKVSWLATLMPPTLSIPFPCNRHPWRPGFRAWTPLGEGHHYSYHKEIVKWRL